MPANTLDLVTELTLRRAAPADLQGVLTLLARTAGWLNGLGVRQWPAGGFPAGRIEPLIGEGVMYVLDAGEDADADADAGVRVPAATIAVDGHADPEFWTPGDRPGDALYVHKLAVSRAYSGQGLGEALLDWAALRAAVHGRPYLRLDCAKDNAGLQSYYRRAGFRHVRTVDLPHRASGALFERDAPGALPVGSSRRRTPAVPVVPAPRSGHATQARRVLDITAHNELIEC
ncbi:N-acetyltransferase [Microbispora sp. H10836]|uniref:GNAT family N-acetyltransferase n=1 Tax=Microbispora sp. H10836 TaxID=2729106 RepID=UPI0014759B5A|nr:GNAT family N-acetyltransferase [Microbispora sp. H10836]